MNRTIEVMKKSDCYGWTKFSKAELQLLMTHLRIPAYFAIDNRNRFTGEETLLICLTRISGPFDSWKSMDKAFGGYHGHWEELFGDFIDYIYSIFYHKITGDSMRQWTSPQQVEHFRRLIWSKTRTSPCAIERFLSGISDSFDILDVAFEAWKVMGFIDDTAERVCRTGSGPDGDYEHAPRRELAEQIQAAFYSGYFKAHTLKYQSLIIPNGMWASVYGAPGRHNDSGVLNMSGIVEYLM